MRYVAHAGIRLLFGISDIQKSVWNPIKQTDEIAYCWRMNRDNTIDVIAGLFDEKHEALAIAKQMYVTLIYLMLKRGIKLSNDGCGRYETTLFTDEYLMSYEEFVDQEPFFFWTKRNQGGLLGPGVFEVDHSLDEFDDYKHWSVEIANIEYGFTLKFDEIDTFTFEYSRETQPLLNSLLTADFADSFGLSMTLFTSILEHFCGNMLKSETVCKAIDQLIEATKTIGLDTEEEHQLIGLLQSGKNLSSRSKCQIIAEAFARDSYGQYTTREIVNQAYSARSVYAHGDNCESESFPAAPYIKSVAMDVIKSIAQNKALG